MNNCIKAGGMALLAFLCSCAHLPDVTVGYYLAQSQPRFKVIRTVACDANNMPIVVTSVTPAVLHWADQAQFIPLRLSGLKGAFSDTDVKFDFYDDGRLKNVNATGTGQGEVIFKTAVTIASTAAALAFDGGAKGYPEECEIIKGAGGGKPLTLTYEGAVDVTKIGSASQDIPADPTSGIYASKLATVIGRVCAQVGTVEPANAPAAYQAESGGVILKARQPALLNITVTAGAIGGCRSDTIWEGRLPVAQLGVPYSLPIPVAKVFGKQVFAVCFAESGALTSLQYASNGGVGQTLNVASSALTALSGETTAQKAADVKAQADLILQQQRLIQCQADPKSCK
ncbi:MAG TPA: hypothetical protein VF928_03630 [Usitatibacteraceae bacterium]